MAKTVRLTVNGTSRTCEGDTERPLLWHLRDELGLTGTKYGCGIARCGACSVHIEGRGARACVAPVSSVAGKRVITIEGVGDRARLHLVQRAWIEEDVSQCGYCQAGQIMAAIDLLARIPDPSDRDIDTISNLCRCGTYVRVRRAIKRAAALMKAKR